MNIPDDDSDLVGQTSEQIGRDLANRDLIIQHGLIDDLVERNDIPNEPVDNATLDGYIAESTATTRLKSLFFPDQMLTETKFSQMGANARRMPFIIGGVVGFGVAGVRLIAAYDEFVRSNQLTAFRTAELAKRRAADYSFFKALTLGCSTGAKAFLLTSGCYTFPLILTAIQGKTSFWEYAVGWGSACSLYCFQRGRRQTLIAGLVAVIPGLVYGSVNFAAARNLGLTFEDLYRDHMKLASRYRLDQSPSLTPVPT